VTLDSELLQLEREMYKKYSEKTHDDSWKVRYYWKKC